METNPQLNSVPAEDIDEVQAYSFGGTPIGSPTPAISSPAVDTNVSAVPRQEDFREYSTVTEKLGEIPIGLTEGAVKAAPVGAGTLMGLGIGMKVAPFVGPFAPLAPIVGAGIGMVAGGEAEDAVTALANKYSLFPDPERPDLAPFREGAKTTGSALPFAAGVRFLPDMVDNWTSRIVSALGRSARETPKLFATVESMGAVGSGIGGGIAEERFPGEPLPKFLLEFGGGVLFPFRTVVSNFGEAKNLFSKQPSNLFGQGKAESRAAERLYKIFNDPYILETFKEDPQKVVAALRAPEISGIGVTGTAAQKSGSTVLSAFEASLAKQNAQFGGDVQSKGEAYMKAHKELVNLLTQTQDPQALVKAAQFQSDYFRDLIATRLKLAQANIDPALKNLAPDTPEYSKKIGESLKVGVDKALEDLRTFESSLYNKAKSFGYRELTDADLTRLNIPKEQWAAYRAAHVAPKQGKASSLIYQALEILEDRGLSYGEDVFSPYVFKKLKELGLDEATVKLYNDATLTRSFRETGVLPESVRNEIDKKIGLITPSQIRTFRGDLLTASREAKAGRLAGDANAYGKLASAALSDLQAFKIPEYDEALRFSRTLNDYFTRAFPAEISATKRSGADKIPPEILVNNFFNTLASTGDKTALRMRELESAVELAAWAKAVDDPTKAVATRDEWVQAIQNGDQKTLRRLAPIANKVKQESYVLSVDDAFKKIFEQDVRRLFTPVSVNTATGTMNRLEFNREKYTNFIVQNEQILKRFHPALFNDLQNVNKAEEYFRYVLDETSALNRSLRDKSAFAAVLNSPENITRVVSDALNSGDPVTQLKRLVDLTKNKRVVKGTGLGDAAQRGLASSLYDWAFLKAAPEPGGPMRESATFNPAAFKAAMFGPIKPKQPSLSEIMVKNGLATVDEMARLKNIAETIEKTQKVMGTRRFVETLNNINPLEDLAIRMAGTNIVSPLAPEGPGALVAAGAGVRTFKKLFEEMPMGKTRAVLERAAKDPEFMASLLERGKTYDQRSYFNIGKRVIQSMQRNGLTPLSVATMNYFDQKDPPMTDEEAMEMLESPSTGAPASKLLRQLPPAPPTTGVPGLSSAPSVRPQGPGPRATPPAPPGQPQTSSRQMLQSLFPFDTTLRAGSPLQ
jgi:hypothetical protein